MSKLLHFCWIYIFTTTIIISQTTVSGGEVERQYSECVSPTQRAEIISKLKTNTKILTDKGILSSEPKKIITSFEWPLQQAAGFNYNSYYSQTNFVDHDLANPGFLEDYNCGQRTYDVTNYNHRGTDIILWPFGWHMLDDEQVEVIAAAAGTIILKDDGNPNTNCDFSNPNWNAIYIEHADGSVAWYGHLKSGTLNSKNVGDNVAAGEYLGIVASSGSSTYPHLHFEVWEDNTYTNLIDPYAGPCNDLNTVSWWANQKPYRESTLNHLMTNNACPQFYNCPTPADINEQNIFSQGDQVYFTAYYHDQLQNHVSDIRILQPNGSVWSSWSHVNPSDYNDSWWCWSWIFPGTEPPGNWIFELTYQGEVFTSPFTIIAPLPVELTKFTASKNKDVVDLNWETNGEVNNNYFNLQKAKDGIDFTTIAKIEGSGTTNERQKYAYIDQSPFDGKNYYRLEQIDFDGSKTISEIVNLNFEAIRKASVFPNPVVSNSVFINSSFDTEAKTLSIYNVEGKLLRDNVKILESNQKIDLDNITPGVLIFKLETENSSEYIRVLYMN